MLQQKPVLRVSPAQARVRLLSLEELPVYVKLLVYAEPGKGKAVALDTLIPTPDGFKKMADIVVGDVVYDGRGEETRVVYVSPVYLGHKCYKVVFDDGAEVVADAEHRWKVQTAQQRTNADRRRGGAKATDYSVVTTEEMLASLRVRADERLNYSVDVATFKGRYRELPVEPYVLGVWLGDGTALNATVTTPDVEVLQRVRELGVAVGEPFGCNTGIARTYRFGRLASGAALQSRLRELGILGNKRIPRVYLFSSVEQRLELLRGLMDADGYVNAAGQCEISTANQDLVSDIRTLLASLGIKSNTTVKTFFAFGKERVAYRIRFTTELPIATLQRKKERLPRRVRLSTKRRYVAAVEEVPSVPVRCIAVDSPEHTYLCTKDFVVTHNTFLGATAPDPIILLTETEVSKPTLKLAAQKLGVMPKVIIIDSLEAMDAALDFLEAGGHGGKTAVLDSLTDLNRFVIRQMVKEGALRRPSHDPDVPEMGDWYRVEERTRDYIRRLRNLPMHVVAICLLADIREEAVVAPALQPRRLMYEVAAYFNMVGQLVARESGEKQDEVIRELIVEAGQSRIAKNPGGVLPPVVRNPNLTTIFGDVAEQLAADAVMSALGGNASSAQSDGDVCRAAP